MDKSREPAHHKIPANREGDSSSLHDSLPARPAHSYYRTNRKYRRKGSSEDQQETKSESFTNSVRRSQKLARSQYSYSARYTTNRRSYRDHTPEPVHKKRLQQLQRDLLDNSDNNNNQRLSRRRYRSNTDTGNTRQHRPYRGSSSEEPHSKSSPETQEFQDTPSDITNKHIDVQRYRSSTRYTKPRLSYRQRNSKESYRGQFTELHRSQDVVLLTSPYQRIFRPTKYPYRLTSGKSGSFRMSEEKKFDINSEDSKSDSINGRTNKRDMEAFNKQLYLKSVSDSDSTESRSFFAGYREHLRDRKIKATPDLIFNPKLKTERESSSLESFPSVSSDSFTYNYKTFEESERLKNLVTSTSIRPYNNVSLEYNRLKSKDSYLHTSQDEPSLLSKYTSNAQSDKNEEEGSMSDSSFDNDISNVSEENNEHHIENSENIVSEEPNITTINTESSESLLNSFAHQYIPSNYLSDKVSCDFTNEPSSSQHTTSAPSTHFTSNSEPTQTSPVTSTADI